MKNPARLVLAGGLRRTEDRGYFQHCERLICELGLSDRVDISGFVPDERIDSLYRQATLVVAPFRRTSGSGSLAQAFARAVPVLASDLPLNREIETRVAGSLAFFKSEDPASCAEAMDALLGDSAQRERLACGALQYAKTYSPKAVAQMHVGVYRELRPHAGPENNE